MELILIAFFFYYNGELVARRVSEIFHQIARDRTQHLFKVIGEVGTDAAKIRDSIKALKGFETVTGRLIEYAPTRVAVKPVSIQIVKNGAFHFYASVTDEKIIRD